MGGEVVMMRERLERGLGEFFRSFRIFRLAFSAKRASFETPRSRLHLFFPFRPTPSLIHLCHVSP